MPATILVLLASVALAAVASHRATRPADPLRPRLAPWRTLSLVGGVVGFFALLHLLTLLGLQPGRPS